jgi:hypothetical protein
MIGGLRSLPVEGDVQGAKDRLRTITVRPLNPPKGWREPSWVDLTPQPFDMTPLAFETGLEYWRALHEVVDSEPHLDAYTVPYEKWFLQAVAVSPAMFRRSVGAGSLYWLGLRDKTDAYLDGSNTYTLTVPAKLFWSITVYDAETRSQIQTDQNKAALRSLFELADLDTSQAADLHFAPRSPR